MKTLIDIAAVLRNAIEQQGLTQDALSQRAGISRQTLSKVLSGRADFKTTTLLALADRLGLEIMIVPKAIAPGLAYGSTDPEPQVKNAVQQALARISQGESDPGSRQR